MDALTKLIRDRLDARQMLDVSDSAIAAVRAVLDIHQPKDDVSYFGDTRLRCTVCQRRGLPPQWPCDTVQAVAAAMGVTP